MKYYQGQIKVSATSGKTLKCEVCGKDCLGLTIREDKVKLCSACVENDIDKEFLNVSGNFK